MNYLATMIAKVDPWTQADAETKAPSVIQRLKTKGVLSATNSRPVVYELSPHWYLDNLSNMPAYCETAPHLEARILQAFGKHCGPVPESEPAPAPEPARPSAVDQIAEQLDRLIRDTASEMADKRLKNLRYKVEDRAQALVNATNKVRALESQNRKLETRVDRLSDVIDEKNRVNAILQKRLNDIRHGSKRPGKTGGGTFALADLLHIEGRTGAVIDASGSARDVPKTETGADDGR
jgi:hypothetical protein